MGEKTAVEVSRPFINELTIQKLGGLPQQTLRNGGELLWNACSVLQLPVQSYTMSMLYFQRYTLLNPHVREMIEAPERDSNINLENVCCACITAMLLIGENFKKVSEIMDAVYGEKKDASSTNSPEEAKILPPNENIVSINNIQRDILETNCFDMGVSCANIALIKIAKSLDPQPNKDIVKCAWKLCLDAYQTEAVLRFRDYDVAACCLDLAYRVQGPDFKLFTSGNKPRYLSWVPMRTSTRIMLLYLRTCSRQRWTTHSGVLLTNDMHRWLESLQNKQPHPTKRNADNTFWIRDKDASTVGTIRFKVE